MLNKLSAFVIALCFSASVYGQANTEYTEWINKALSFYHAQQYQQSADAFTQAFASYGGSGFSDDRYTAACSWALAGNKDSAFFQLERIAYKGNFKNIDRMQVDDDLVSLRNDPRWEKIFAQVKLNKEKATPPPDKKQKKLTGKKPQKKPVKK